MERRRNFSWFPPWVYLLLLAGLLPCAIVASILTKNMVVYVPFCGRHKNHWLSRNLLIWLGLFAGIVVGVLALALTANDPPGRQRAGDDWIFGLACSLSLLIALAWVIFTIVAQHTAIRTTEITDRTITLTGVCDAFIDALEDEDQARYARPAPEEDKDRLYDDPGDWRKRRQKPEDYQEDY